MPRTPWGGLCLLFLMVAALSAAGADPIRLEKIVETVANPNVTLRNLKGHVVVKSWDKTQLDSAYSTLSPYVQVEMEALPSQGPAEKIRLTTYRLTGSTGEFDKSADYTLEVPVGSSLKIYNPEGRVEVQGLQGSAEVESVGGSISIGDVAGHLAVRSVGGDIDVIRPSGRVEASSITGKLLFASPASPEIQAGTTSGKIRYEGDFARAGSYKLRSYSGDIEILYAKSASFELRARSVHGKVLTDPDLPRRPERRPASTPSSGNSFTGAWNRGSAILDLTSFSGTIRVFPEQPGREASPYR